MGDGPTEEGADPGHRIHHVDSVTGESTEVPPFTSHGGFTQMKAEGKLTTNSPSEDGDPTKDEDEEQPTFDGCTKVREAYGGGVTEEDNAAATREELA